MNRVRRCPLLPIAILYIGGVLCSEILSFIPTHLLGMALIFTALAGLGWRRARPWMLGLTLVGLGGLKMIAASKWVEPGDLRLRIDRELENVEVCGILLERPEYVDFSGETAERPVRWKARFRLMRWTQNGVERAASNMVLLQASTDHQGRVPWTVGQTLFVRGVLRPVRPAVSESLFDYRAHLAREGIHYEMLETRNGGQWAADDPEGNRGGIRHWPAQFQQWACQTLARGLPPGEKQVGLLHAMALGWKEGVEGELKQVFIRSGTMHLFAISGLHVGLIAVVLMTLLRVLNLARVPCCAAVMISLWFYAAATGWQPSAVRATIMSSVILFGAAIARPSSLLNSMAGAALLILLWDPYQLYHPGFQLSFAVVAMLGLWGERIQRMGSCWSWIRGDPLRLPQLRNRWMEWIRRSALRLFQTFAISAAAWAGSLPLVAYYFHLVTPVSLLANVVIVPLGMLAVMSCFGSLITGPWWAWGSELFNHSAWLWMTLMVKASDKFASVPFAWFALSKFHFAWLICFYGGILGLSIQRVRWGLRWWLIVAMLFFGIGLSVWEKKNENKELHLEILGLSGGEAVLVDAPGTEQDLMLDCGDSRAWPWPLQECLHLKGWTAVPWLVLTHGDARHLGAAEKMLLEWPVGNVGTTGHPSRSPADRRLREALRDGPWNHVLLREGSVVAGWDVLHPTDKDAFPRADDNCLVLKRNWRGVRILIVSDLGKDAQNALLERTLNLQADILVSGLPANQEALIPAFLKAVDPQLILISGGAFPIQQRPSDEVRRRLEAHGAPVLYNVDEGWIRLSCRSGEWRIRTAKGTRLQGKEALTPQ